MLLPWKGSQLDAISHTVRRKVICFSCECSYEYDLTRESQGEGTSALFLDNAGAEERAINRAEGKAAFALAMADEPVPCPICGVYQPEMVEVFSERFGRNLDPNEFAKQRAGTTDQKAWQKALAENTENAYSTFIKVWPHSSLTGNAQQKLYALESRRREEAWTPAARRRSIIIRTLLVAVVFGGLAFISWKFGRPH